MFRHSRGYVGEIAMTEQTKSGRTDRTTNGRGKFRDSENHASWKEVYAAMEVRVR